jgi:hypothetical protein
MDLESAAAPAGHRHHQQDRIIQRFAKWLPFGGEVIGENDPGEQQKHLRYNDLVATAVILQNAVDMTRIIGELEWEEQKIRQQKLFEPAFGTQDGDSLPFSRFQHVGIYRGLKGW